MKVLIADFDLFQKIGGGQTFYCKIIQKNPNIDFYYLITSESPEAVRPANAHPIAYQEKYSIADFANFYDVTPPKWMHRAFVIASNIAASVTGYDFDIVDLPDYEPIVTLIRPALRHHHVGFERIALSMHGLISTSIKLNWSTEGNVDLPLDLQEKMQYRTVDIRYGISKTYLDEWRGEDLESHYLNPLWFISLPKPTPVIPSSVAPRLNFFGRTEKRKGPDIFVELAWWLPRSSFSTANIIGPDSYNPQGIGSSHYIREMARHRLPDINILPAMSQLELAQQFASKSITILPSRYDTLNLVALESLLSGCPTAIGSGAGACRFIEETFPKIPFITIDINNVYSCLPSIYAVLQNYQEYREQLKEALLSYTPEISGPDQEQIYSSAPSYDHAVRKELDYWYSQLMYFYENSSPSLKAVAIKYIKSQVSPAIKEKIGSYRSKLNFNNIQTRVKQKLLASVISDDLKIVDQVLKGRLLTKRYQQLFNSSEQTEGNLSNKVRNCWDLGNSFRIDRVRLWQETARLERLRGNELFAATYQVRVMRLLGGDRFGYLESTKRVLEANGFSREARVAEAMYGDFPDREERCADLLNEALIKNTFNQKWEYEFVDDRRELPNYRASIIVSLYNAATKLPLFLKALQSQTMIQAGAAEVILIDSGSPADEYGAFKQVMSQLSLPIVYARCAQRETIQSAWNRGIELSLSPYLAFLGVDETILPDCLEVLAGELDADPSLDWVLGNSIVTNVDKNGTWFNDIMVYDRQGYKQDLVYLETCYLSWVGALYRRSIHDRFGYYDASFTAAGDTEFKNRVLPFIKTKFVPRTLGIFWNYPEERTTQHPRAELEDLRAWYLHRSLAGIKYAFALRSPKEAEGLLYASLRYRKSYCQHWSTDIEYAYNLATFLQQKVPDSHTLKYLDGIQEVLNAYRSLDWIPKLSGLSPLAAALRTQRITTKIEQHHRALENQTFAPIYKIFNDNRHEQHSNPWPTKD